MTAIARPAGSRGLAVTLLRLTLGWNLIEGFVAVTSGIAAGSVALIGFGLDSFIEVTAAGILLWRMNVPVDDSRVEHREQVARRIIGVTFLVLAAYVIAQSAFVLITGEEPEVSAPGIGLAIASLALMPVLGLMKRRNALRLHSHALIAESTETLVCSYLSLTLLLGLGLNALTGWGWADVASALAMVPWIAKEGIEGLRGDSCEGH